MNLFSVVVTAVLATIATLLLTIVGAWSLWPTTAEASVNLAHTSSTWQSDGSGHCSHLSADHLVLGEAVAGAVLKLDDTQRANLAAVSTQLESWRSQAQETCLNTDLTTLDGGLAGIESLLHQSAQTLTELRPAVNDFYASLDANQQARLRDFMHNHRTGHHNHRSRH